MRNVLAELTPRDLCTQKNWSSAGCRTRPLVVLLSSRRACLANQSLLSGGVFHTLNVLLGMSRLVATTQVSISWKRSIAMLPNFGSTVRHGPRAPGMGGALRALRGAEGADEGVQLDPG